PDHVGSGVGDVHQTGVAGRVVLQVVAVVPAGQDSGVLVAAVPVGLLIAHAVRPALVSRGGGHRGGLVLRRPSSGSGTKASGPTPAAVSQSVFGSIWIREGLRTPIT